MEYDEIFLARAFELAQRGRFSTSPNPNVGCVIVREGQIIGEGYHQQHPDERHAEIYALCMAGDAARGASAYITLEPCSHHGRTPPCANALINAGIIRVVSAISDPNPKVSGRGFYQLRQAGIEVRYGLMLAEAEALNPGFLKRMRTGFPWIRLKLASSLDGRTAMASGESKWITSPEARQDVQCWRAESDAILSTATTVLTDNPDLTVSWPMLPKDIQTFYPQERLRQPIRVIIDSTNRVTPAHRIIQGEGKTWLARLKQDNLAWPASVEQLLLSHRKGSDSTHLDLVLLIKKLGCRQINTLWIEAGATLAGALLSTGLVDELILYQAPKLLGNNARPLCFIPRLEQLHQAIEFQLINIKQIGPDIRLRLKPSKSAELTCLIDKNLC
ncbi:bifunctional diaminohydroxyphosphoribosylaminopyrimidine deaminase/5-amino-6-(5-phosphoribosylamino)uracil reductase RibD [Candidatus Steffania adelgidicola]|uniref:bifunctional diaminohydroxyphosphoribosylaminopyrimidine deaminase/5-amino-6-(5-phosphoribosylamino)uracil reductase RibD n=1 Tax=Candidatus Steffania adelgidicola TaxID=1076626 RepID=UPI001D00BD3A|nr:bifunctional diaminohydroxyphosphoribosylaminopyrimidine deaminase/5-amino-6-(5-phosphoribosylamino)uracil reductase RibD [Candidatus Steffania adelgidicola]UDG79863.1 Riboflavin biosynthesis protein RibD [Candidatus Steffania adelgidicola]